MTSSIEEIIPEAIQEILPQTITRLTACLPRIELDLICKEAKACEYALKKELELLEAELDALDGKEAKPKADDDYLNEANKDNFGLNEPTMTLSLLPLPYQPRGGGPEGVGNKNYLSTVDEILKTEFTPPDRYFTVSAVFGRLKDPLKLPVISNPNSMQVEETEQVMKKRQMMLDKQKALLDLEKNPIYTSEHADSQILLNLWKRISSHKTAMVFRKPVNPAEAPGYKERIGFPIDLSLVRKFITSRVIKSYKELHQRIGLICHNCVKFNGRESDYAIITREFEDIVDEKILEAVRAAAETSAATIGKPAEDQAAVATKPVVDEPQTAVV